MIDLVDEQRQRLDQLLAELGDRPLRHATAGRGYLSEHDPWYVEATDPSTGARGCAGQRAFLRSRAPIRVIVAGRQSGKTHQVAEEVIRIILSRPGSESCLLMPTYKSTKGALRHLRRALAPLGARVRWKEQDKCFCFPNGATLYLRTADDKSGVPTRGLTLDGVLWVDEASFVPQSAWDAAQATLAAVSDPVVIVTTTPLGRKSWVFDLCASAADDPDLEWFRFRTTDSPYHHPSFVAKLRKRYGQKRAQEELDAVFLGDTDAPFPLELVQRAFVDAGLPLRGERFTLGVDLGKRHDYTVIVLMNEFGEAWVLDRFRESREKPDERFWPATRRRIAQLAKKYDAIVVVDESGGMGSVMADNLTEDLGKARVNRVKTARWKVKAELMEALISDFENGRIQIDGKGRHAEEARHELIFFPAPERVVEGGVPLLKYVGPPDERDTEDEEALHDDTVIALALARHGAVNCWTPAPKRSSLAKFRAKRPPSGGGFDGGFGVESGGGYIFGRVREVPRAA